MEHSNQLSIRQPSLQATTTKRSVVQVDEQEEEVVDRVSITSVPAEVLLQFLLPDLDVKDIFALGATCRYLRNLTLDPALWRIKTQLDFSYSPSTLAPPHPNDTTYYRRIYLGIRRPRPYIWGSTDNSRLGVVSSDPRLGPGVVRHIRAVDSPMEVSTHFEVGSEGRRRTWVETLRDSIAARASGGQVGRWGLSGLSTGGWATGEGVPRKGGGERGEGEKRSEFGEDQLGKVGIIELQAGGWSFTARDLEGGVWVWGQLDGSLIRFRSPSWEDPYCQCPEPTRIPLPCKAESISAGRQHLLVLDSDNLIWELRAWGRAFHHTAPALTSPSSPGTSGITPHIIQLSTGWTHSACLTSSGQIYVWFPFSDDYVNSLTPESELHGPLGADEDDLSRVLRWGTVNGDCVESMETIPNRPSRPEVEEAGGIEGLEMDQDWDKVEAEWEELERNGKGGKGNRDGEKVVKIASGLEFILALKKNGEVWAARVRPNDIGPWIFLPYFSSPHITHISAQFETIASYSPPTPTSPIPLRTSKLNLSSLTPAPLHTTNPTSSSPRTSPSPHRWSTTRPNRLIELDNVPVIQFVAGDYHFAALTAKGEMWTWGQNGRGQLGTGWTGPTAPTGTNKPTKVVFNGRSRNGNENRGKEEEEAFVFAITAAGWHTGALVLGDPTKSKPKATQKTTSNSNSDNVTQSSPNIYRQGVSTSSALMPGAFPAPGVTTTNLPNPVPSTAPVDAFRGRRLQLPLGRPPVVTPPDPVEPSVDPLISTNPRPDDHSIPQSGRTGNEESDPGHVNPMNLGYLRQGAGHQPHLPGGRGVGLRGPTFRIGYAGRGARIGQFARSGVGRGDSGDGGSREGEAGRAGEGGSREMGETGGEGATDGEGNPRNNAPQGRNDVF